MPQIVTKLPHSGFTFLDLRTSSVVSSSTCLFSAAASGSDTSLWDRQQTLGWESAAVHIRLQQHSCDAGSHGIKPFFQIFLSFIA